MSAHSRLRRIAVLSSAVLVMSLGSPAFAATAPAVATKLKATTTSSSATLTWKAPTGATSYGVCLSTSAASKTCFKTFSKLTKTTLTIKDLTPTGGTDYFFSVLSYKGTAFSKTAKFGFNLAAPTIPAPDAVTGMTDTVTTNGVTIVWPKAANADTYSVCLVTNGTSTTCTRSSTASAALTATFTGLAVGPGTDWYYIVQAKNGAGSSSSARVPFDLPVGDVPGFAVLNSTPTSINWAWDATTNAETYELQLATSADMTAGLTTFSSATPAYSATGLRTGTNYFFRVRGMNGAVAGAYTSVGTLHLTTASFTAVVVTYNLCGQNKCVSSSNGIKNWNPTRKPLAGELVRSTGADIIATQESHDKDTHFITELPGFTLGAYFSAKSLFYKTSQYDRLRFGTITLSSARRKYAVWMELRDKATRTRFIVSDTHTTSGKGKTLDDDRYAETKILLDAINAVNTDNLPEVYAGDFNSNKSNAKSSGGYDAVDRRMKAAQMRESLEVADNAWHVEWNSANQAINPPYKYGDHVDHIYVDSQVHVTDSDVVLSLDSTGTRYATPFPSDHNPVRAAMTIQGNP